MKITKRIYAVCSVFVVAGALVLGGCGGGGDGVSPTAAGVSAPGSALAVSPTVSGVAAAGVPLRGTVYLRDAGNAAERSAEIGSDGFFAFDVEGLKPPYLLRAEWRDDTGRHQLYSLAAGPGTANVNPLSSAAVVAASGVADASSLAAGLDSARLERTADALPGIVVTLQEELKPLLDYFNAVSDPIVGSYPANHNGLDAVFEAVAIEVVGGDIVAINKSTLGHIFVCSTADISSGRFNGLNMPGAVPAATPAG